MYVLDKRNTLWLRDMVRQTSLGKSAAGADLPVGPAADDFPRDVCLTVSRNHKVFLLYQDLAIHKPNDTSGSNDFIDRSAISISIKYCLLIKLTAMTLVLIMFLNMNNHKNVLMLIVFLR